MVKHLSSLSSTLGNIPGTIYFALLQGTYHFSRYDSLVHFAASTHRVVYLTYLKCLLVPKIQSFLNSLGSLFFFRIYHVSGLLACNAEFHHILPCRDIDPYQFRYKLPVVSISVLNYNNCESAKTFCNHLYVQCPRRVNG